MVGILLFYWGGLFSGAMLVSGRVSIFHVHILGTNSPKEENSQHTEKSFHLHEALDFLWKPRHRLWYGCQPKNRGILPPKWMVNIMKNPMNKWMIWGAHPYFWKHPYTVNTKSLSLSLHDCTTGTLEISLDFASHRSQSQSHQASSIICHFLQSLLPSSKLPPQKIGVKTRLCLSAVSSPGSFEDLWWG